MDGDVSALTRRPLSHTVFDADSVSISSAAFPYPIAISLAVATTGPIRDPSHDASFPSAAAVRSPSASVVLPPPAAGHGVGPATAARMAVLAGVDAAGAAARRLGARRVVARPLRPTPTPRTSRAGEDPAAAAQGQAAAALRSTDGPDPAVGNRFGRGVHADGVGAHRIGPVRLGADGAGGPIAPAVLPRGHRHRAHPPRPARPPARRHPGRRPGSRGLPQPDRRQLQLRGLRRAPARRAAGTGVHALRPSRGSGQGPGGTARGR